mgnify:CR=1 FL=1
MLIELSCDKLAENEKPRATIRFKKGLNVVLGDANGSNSIGKTTFLMLIDFVFGGNTYVEKAVDVIEHIGVHTVKFAFEFGEDKYYFSRSTNTNQIVNICDASYTAQKEIPLSDYCIFLKNKYGMTQQDLTFREAVTRYSRIYQKDNTDERHPLSLYPGESQEKSVLSLIKLFNYNNQISGIKKQIEECQEKVQLHRLAEKHDFVPSIKNKKEYSAKQKELEKLRIEQESFAVHDELQGRTTDEINRIMSLRRALQQLRAGRSRIENILIRLNDNSNNRNIYFESDFSGLKYLFPDLNLRSLELIEHFHTSITSILSEELVEEIQNRQAELNTIMEQISRIESELHSFDVPSGISRKLLDEYSNRQKSIESIQLQQKHYDGFQQLIADIKEYRKQYSEYMSSIILKLQQEINETMTRINDYVYESTKKSPILGLNEKSYSFITPDDTGTGTLYKSLIVLDLSIFKLTNLPLLIHDSVLFKNIADIPLEHILELYTLSEKQIFIALDKASSYSDKTAKQLNDNAVLHLSNQGKELFGFSWGNITT